MAKVFSDGDLIDAAFLNKVSASVTDGIGDKKTPGEVRVFIGAEVSGAAGTVQTDLDRFKAQRGIANGLCPLGPDAQVNAAFLPPTGGYAGVYDTQALMVAAGAGHLSGEVFLVTADGANNGEYTATIDAPTVIVDYYFNSGSVATHTHPGDEVAVTSGVGGPDLQSYVTANDLLTDDIDDKIDDAPSDGTQYARKNAAWEAVASSSGGDLKSDFSVQMIGSPSLNQDIATKASSEAVFTDRLAGYLPTGKHDGFIGDLDTLHSNQKVAVWSGSITNGPPISANEVAFLTVSQSGDDSTSSQTWVGVDSTAVTVMWVRGWKAAGWSDWVKVGASVFDEKLSGFKEDGSHSAYNGDLNDLTTNARHVSPFAVGETNNWPAVGNYSFIDVYVRSDTSQVLQIISEANSYPKKWSRISNDGGTTWTAWLEDGGYAGLKVTQAEYDALTPDANTLYYIVG